MSLGPPRRCPKPWASRQRVLFAPLRLRNEVRARARDKAPSPRCTLRPRDSGTRVAATSHRDRGLHRHGQGSGSMRGDGDGAGWASPLPCHPQVHVLCLGGHKWVSAVGSRRCSGSAGCRIHPMPAPMGAPPSPVCTPGSCWQAVQALGPWLSPRGAAQLSVCPVGSAPCPRHLPGTPSAGASSRRCRAAAMVL